MSTPSIIRVEELTRTVDQRRILDRVSLDLAVGECIGLIGPSGSGKSSLLRAIAMLDPVDLGTTWFQGQPISGRAVPEYRQKVIYLSQRPAMIDGTVEENLRLPFTWSVKHQAFGQRAAWDPARVGDLLEASGTTIAMDQPARTLSGGQHQWVAVVRAIQLDPEVLLLDEPTASLDGESAERLEEMLQRWRTEKSDRSWIWVSHDQESLDRVCDRVAMMDQGRLVRDQASSSNREATQ